MAHHMMSTSKPRDERGIALIVAVLGIVVVGALFTGFFMVAVQENRVGHNSRRAEQAFAAAEHGINATIANWNAMSWNDLAVMASDTVWGTLSGGTGSYAGRVQRLNNEIFLVDVTGVANAGRARQRIGAFVKLRNLLFDIQAVLTTRGNSQIGGNAGVNGNDQGGPWGKCPPLEGLKPGIRIPDADQLTFGGGCKSASCIDGDPPVDVDPSIDDDTFFEYGDADWDLLVSLATKRLPGDNYQNIAPSLTGGGDCNTADIKNWGDPENPTAPCGDYLPIIYAPGNLTVNTGVGQGILLVEGDLSAQGKFEFYGIVIVKGSLMSAGNGNKFHGGVMAANFYIDNNMIFGTVDLAYSSCALARAQQAGSGGTPLRSRGWIQLF